MKPMWAARSREHMVDAPAARKRRSRLLWSAGAVVPGAYGWAVSPMPALSRCTASSRPPSQLELNYSPTPGRVTEVSKASVTNSPSASIGVTRAPVACSSTDCFTKPSGLRLTHTAHSSAAASTDPPPAPIAPESRSSGHCNEGDSPMSSNRPQPPWRADGPVLTKRRVQASVADRNRAVGPFAAGAFLDRALTSPAPAVACRDSPLVDECACCERPDCAVSICYGC